VRFLQNTQKPRPFAPQVNSALDGTRAPTMNEYSLGRFNFKLAYRDLGSDRGLAIHVFGPTDNEIEEVLRFDCFENDPHYHLAWSYRDDPFIRIDSKQPFAWSIEVMRNGINQLLSKATAQPMNESELDQLGGVLDSIQRKGSEIVSAI